MREDRIMTIFGILTAAVGLMALSVGRLILGGIVLLVAAGIFYSRGGGRFNDRSLYEKVVRTDATVDSLYRLLKDTDSPLGRPWKAAHRGSGGECIVYGPGEFGDCVIIFRSKGSLNIKHITELDNIIRGEEDEYRFKGLADPGSREVTYHSYARFAAADMSAVMLIDHLTEIAEELAAGRKPDIPSELDKAAFYYHNSANGCFRDSEENDILEVRSRTFPFEAKVLDADGNEMASVAARAYDNKDNVAEKEGFDLYADGELFGEITRSSEGDRDCFTAKTDAGRFTARVFPACRRANVACNYTISKDGKLMAVIGGSPKLLFDSSDGYCSNDIVLSYDDDYLVLYAVIEIFIMTLNRKFLK